MQDLGGSTAGSPVGPRRIIRGNAVPLVPWRNGHGQTRDLLTRLEPGGGLGLQIGIAELAADAPFSDFAGLDRLFTPIGDAAVQLAFEDGPWLDCPPLLPVSFTGERRTRMRLPHGPSRAFNVIAARERWQAGVTAMRLADGTQVTPHLPQGGAVFCVAGGLRPCPARPYADEGPGRDGGYAALAAGDLLLLPAGEAACFTADGHATLLVVSLRATP